MSRARLSAPCTNTKTIFVFVAFGGSKHRGYDRQQTASADDTEYDSEAHYQIVFSPNGDYADYDQENKGDHQSCSFHSEFSPPAIVEGSQLSEVPLYTIGNVVVTRRGIEPFELCYLSVAIALVSDKIAVITIIPKATSSIK
jgi:hypothetical protein